jgi:hypothetical protein
MTYFFSLYSTQSTEIWCIGPKFSSIVDRLEQSKFFELKYMNVTYYHMPHMECEESIGLVSRELN